MDFRAVNEFKRLFVLFCYFWTNKDKFIELEIEHERALEKHDIDIKERKILYSKYYNIVRETIVQSIRLGIAALVLSIVMTMIAFPSSLFIKTSINYSKILGVISTLLILMATYGQLSREKGSFGGVTYAEHMSRFWFQFNFGVGTVLLFIAIIIG